MLEVSSYFTLNITPVPPLLRGVFALGEVISISGDPLEPYEPFFVEQDPEQHGTDPRAAKLGHVCVESRGLVGVADSNVQTPGDVRSAAIATHVSLGRSRKYDHNKVAQTVAEQLNWTGHHDCGFRRLMSDIIAPIIDGDEVVRANSFKIGMGVLTDDMYEQIRCSLTDFDSRPKSVDWQEIEDPSKLVPLRNTKNKAGLYIANGVEGEYFQTCAAYRAGHSAYVQTSGNEIIRLGERLRSAIPIELEIFAGTMAVLGGSTAKALGVLVGVREKSLLAA